jgi:phage tail tape-measure protein
MLVYMVYDRKTGDIVHVHRVVDAEGRSSRATDEEVMRVLPAGVDAANVGIVATELENVPSGREVMFSVDTARGMLVTTPVRETTNRPAQQKRSGTTRRKRG